MAKVLARSLLNHAHRSFRIVGARPRLFSCLVLSLLLAAVLPNTWHMSTRSLCAWNSGMAAYLALVGWMMLNAAPDSIRRRAASQDEGGFLILVLSILAAVASVGAIVAQLSTVKDMSGLLKALHIGLAAFTILLSFLFIHVMFALHYAHEFYAETRTHQDKPGNTRGGLDFPGDEAPTYGDFLYFSFAIGCASATSDVDVCSKPMRRIVLAHSVLSFFFNATVLALTINIAAGLISAS
jgi:uncharacterized membrane protein